MSSWPKSIDLSVLSHRADYIHRLECNEVEESYLKRLTLRGYLHEQSYTIFRHKNTLTHLVLGIIRSQIAVDVQMSEVMWEAVASCNSLQSLKVTRALVSLTSWSTCWSLCCRLHTLQLQDIDFWTANDENDNISLSM